jgi:redox-sensing transcriptional repressor
MLIGAGNLGRALSAYRGFDAKGFRLVAVFDTDASKVGHKHGEFVVKPMSEVSVTVRDAHVRLAIIAVPADAAQDVADLLVDVGIRGLLNFAPVSLNLPRDVALTTVDVAVQLEQLSFQVNAADVSAKG